MVADTAPTLKQTSPKMATHNELGKKGETLALQFIQAKNYTLLEKNWRFKRAEVDIIAKDEEQNIVIFIEVKTRSSAIFGTPDTFVTAHKERLLADAAQAYCESINHNWEIRFDIISIIINATEQKIEHFEDAFFPGI